MAKNAIALHSHLNMLQNHTRTKFAVNAKIPDTEWYALHNAIMTYMIERQSKRFETWLIAVFPQNVWLREISSQAEVNVVTGASWSGAFEEDIESMILFLLRRQE